MNRRSRWVAVAAVGAVALPLSAAIGTASASAQSGTVAVKGNAPSWAKSANLTGHPGAKNQLTIRVGLAAHDPAGAQSYAAAVSDPSSASYGQYLTPAQYAAKFGPTAADVAAVKNFLTGAGLTVTGQTPSGDGVYATGTVSQIDSAFDTTLGLYKTHGHTLRAPASDARVPSSLGSIVLSVGGLTDTSLAIRPNTVSVNGTQQPVQIQTPCSAYYGQNRVGNLPSAYGHTSFPTDICGYEPSQERAAYGLSPSPSTADGAGATVAIIDAYASPTMASDAATYNSNHSLPAFGSGQYTEYPPSTAYYDQSVCGSWTDEEALDIEAVHSMAPGANIAYVPTASCNDTDFLDAYSRILTPSAGATAPLATIVSNSYGDASDYVDADLQAQEHQSFVQAADEGVGFYFSSGDDGDAAIDNNGVPQPQASANDPAVTAVGGTSLGVGANYGYQFETGWGDDRTYLVQDSKTKQQSWLSVPGDFYAGAGGGTSGVWGEPSYQKGVVPSSLANDVTDGGAAPGRVVPDIAANADPYTGFVEGYSTPTKKGYVYSEGDIGGTSLACPTIAGLMAVAQQRRGGEPIGFANPLLYSLAGKKSAFRDIVPPTTADQKAVVFYSAAAKVTRLVSFNDDSSLKTTTGYDNVTGLGSPAASFANTIAATH